MWIQFVMTTTCSSNVGEGRRRSQYGRINRSLFKCQLHEYLREFIYRVVQKKPGHSTFSQISRKLLKISEWFFAHIKASVCRTWHIHTNFSNSFYSVAPSGEYWTIITNMIMQVSVGVSRMGKTSVVFSGGLATGPPAMGRWAPAVSHFWGPSVSSNWITWI